jgi:hypothetical protein
VRAVNQLCPAIDVIVAAYELKERQHRPDEVCCCQPGLHLRVSWTLLSFRLSSATMSFDEAAELAARLDRIKGLSEELSRTQADSAEAMRLAKDIQREATPAHNLLRPIKNR